ncbi:uncharacterized protein perm1b [Parambassis ranga]|uniref:Uncharacterized protein perm1b n=1 Tax=Parambassis ranga TaxID=210632 RepID=A0A6P7IQX6_9TELE|nr:uncharacterized protein LOC114436851 [Parambassis ranga]
MDDLDHSIHIAEYDWTSFFEESEECWLLQPSLACHDDCSLSDSEASEGSAFSRGPQETQQSSDVKGRDETESRAEDLRDLSVQLNQSGAEEDRLALTDYPRGKIIGTAGETSDTQNSGESEELNDSDSKSTVGLCSGSQTELVNEPHTEAAVDVSSVCLRAEKERWFVTVNDSPARQRLRAASVKKKHRQKKTCEGIRMCSQRQEKSADKDIKLDINKGQCEEGRDTQSMQSCDPSDEDRWAISDSSQVSGEEDELITETSAPTSHDTSTPPHAECVESDELEDSAEFLSIHSNDSESYMSAAESVEEPQHLLQDHLEQLHCSLSLMSDSHVLSLTTQSTQIHSYDSTVSRNEATTSCDHEPSLAFPSASHTATEMPDDDATRNDTHSVALCEPPATPVLQTHKLNLVASDQDDQLSPLPVPDLTITPCLVADSPEIYARAAGHTRPVYAISAFWDEMEKLTINDILHLRMGRSTPPRETHETVTPTADANPSFLVRTSSDSALMDTSDNTDSDYFTQTDESKPDRSSCEFSTSDFEEEYWQFLGISRNTSPDPHDRNQHWTTDSLFLSHEEVSTCSEGRETPVPIEEDLSGRCLDTEESQTSSRRITKSKSMHNVQALSKERLSLQGNDELFLSRCPPLEENTVLKVSGSLGTLIPASFLSSTDSLDYQKSLPEVVESLFTEDKTKTSCVTFYDPEDISVAPVFDYETSVSSLQCIEEKPIPIFSSSHPTVRELTFKKPDFVFLTANCEEMDDFSPFRVASRSFIQADQGGANSWKGLLSIRKIRFHGKGSMWYRRSGDWMFPEESGRLSMSREDPVVTVFSEGRVSSSSPQLFHEFEKQQKILEAFTKEGLFSTLKQSDMCLVCIAFASWVLRSSDPEAADAWKAALLANVSALSAIQYLRQYMKRRNPPGHER